MFSSRGIADKQMAIISLHNNLKFKYEEKKIFFKQKETFEMARGRKRVNVVIWGE